MFVSSVSGHRLFIHRTPQRVAPLALTIGNFDAVHRGHQAMLAQLKESAHQKGLQTAVLLFDPHPRFFFQPDLFRAAWHLRDKILYFSRLGIDHLYVIRFDEPFSLFPPDFFIEDFLIRQLNVRYFLVGCDFSFGKGRAGTADLLSRYAQTGCFELCVFPDVQWKGERFSSTLVREALAAHEFGRVREYLGYSYMLSDRVCYGRQLGRTLGFPTVNMRPPSCPVVRGTFVARVHGVASEPLPSVAHVGVRPSVDLKQKSFSLEAHIFDFSGDLYGRRIAIEFLKHLHDERQYSSRDQLISGIHKDCEDARTYFLNEHCDTR